MEKAKNRSLFDRDREFFPLYLFSNPKKTTVLRKKLFKIVTVTVTRGYHHNELRSVTIIGFSNSVGYRSSLIMRFETNVGYHCLP